SPCPPTSACRRPTVLSPGPASQKWGPDVFVHPTHQPFHYPEEVFRLCSCAVRPKRLTVLDQTHRSVKHSTLRSQHGRRPWPRKSTHPPRPWPPWSPSSGPSVDRTGSSPTSPAVAPTKVTASPTTVRCPASSYCRPPQNRSPRSSGSVSPPGSPSSPVEQVPVSRPAPSPTPGVSSS